MNVPKIIQLCSTYIFWNAPIPMNEVAIQKPIIHKCLLEQITFRFTVTN